jgi:hypothetical protein
MAGVRTRGRQVIKPPIPTEKVNDSSEKQRGTSRLSEAWSCFFINQRAAKLFLAILGQNGN